MFTVSCHVQSCACPPFAALCQQGRGWICSLVCQFHSMLAYYNISIQPTFAFASGCRPELGPQENAGRQLSGLLKLAAAAEAGVVAALALAAVAYSIAAFPQVS